MIKHLGYNNAYDILFEFNKLIKGVLKK